MNIIVIDDDKLVALSLKTILESTGKVTVAAMGEKEKLERSIISENEISDAASPELAAIRRKINRAGMQLRETLDKMIKNKTTQQYLQESNVTIRDGRFVLPVKSEYRGQVSGLIHDRRER